VTTLEHNLYLNPQPKHEIYMFGLFKKKEQPIQKEEPKRVEVMYTADSIKEGGDQELKEQMMRKFKGKVYSRAEIHQMGKVMEMDVWNEFTWTSHTVTRK
jgi:hypothetical protein